MKKTLIEKIKNKTAVVGIIGLGYVGLPLLLIYAEKGFSTIGFDADINKIEKLNKGQTYIKQITAERIKNALLQGKLELTSEFKHAEKCDAIIICLPTPLGKHFEPDLSYIINAMESLSPYIKQGQLISLESTTYPGTTEEEICSRVKQKGFSIGNDFFVVFSPEREDPGNKFYDTNTIPKIVGGHDLSCLEVGMELYGAVIAKIVPVSSTKTAEMTKLLENIYRAVNIGLINEMKMIADKMGIDIWEVIDAAATKPFGFTPFYPGPGLGGHCIPLDPFYLAWKAKEYGFHTHFIELAGEVNHFMPEWVVSKMNDALSKQNKALHRARILVLGIAYKKNIDDMRAIVCYSDPYVPVFPKMRRHYYDLQSRDITPEVLAEMDCVLLATDHDAFDYQMIQKHSQLIIDCRGRYRENFSNVVKA